MKLRLITVVDVDEDAYARDYGLTPGAETRSDALTHAPDLLAEAMTTKAQQMGYLTVVVTTAQVLS